MNTDDALDLIRAKLEKETKYQHIADMRLLMKQTDLALVVKEFRKLIKGKEKKFPHMTKILEAFEYSMSRQPGTGSIAGVNDKGNVKTFLTKPLTDLVLRADEAEREKDGQEETKH